MKKTLFLFVCCISLFACKDDNEEVAPFLEVAPAALNFEQTGGVENITVDANNEWTFADNLSWLTLTKVDQTTLKVEAKENKAETLEGKITITSAGISKSISVNQLGLAPSVLVDQDKLEAEALGGAFVVTITANVEYKVVSSDKWITCVEDENKLSIAVDYNSGAARKGEVNIEVNGTVVKTISISQKELEGKELKATKIKIVKGEASEQQKSEPIEMSFDDNYSTMYHSIWQQPAKFPVTLKYYFAEDADVINFVDMYSRPNGGNGSIKEFDVNVKSRDGEAKLLGSYDFNGSSGKKTLNFTLEKPEYVELVVHSGVGDFVSLAEIEFFRLDEEAGDDEALKIFTDRSCSKLKEGITEEEINAIANPLYKRIATELLAGVYDTEYRTQVYKAIPSPSIIRDQLEIKDGFSQYQNLTGMYFEKGKHIILVGDLQGKMVSVRFPDWMRQPTPGYEPDKDPKGWGLYHQVVQLKEGLNTIDVEYSTNAYIDYFDKNPKGAPEVQINFPTAQINKYFDITKHNNADWKKMLDEAPSPIMDMVGEFIQVAYPVEYYKQFAYDKGVELINNYDKMLRSHYTLLGCFKYNMIPENKILSRVNFNYYMFRDADGVAYLGNASTMGMVVDPNRVVVGDPAWGFCHEVGHVLQMPQLMWGGMGEVSNNIFTLHTTVTTLKNTSRLKNEGVYAKARTNIIDGKRSYFSFNKQDVVTEFQTLVPFWQLYLYFLKKDGNTEFYTDVMQAMRANPVRYTGNNQYRYMFDFIKIATDISKLDLTEFFEKWGFFYVGTITISDYGTYTYNITQAEVDEVKKYIADKKYPKPTEDLTKLED